LARELGEFVTIQFNGTVAIGKFGADVIMDGKLPNGEAYTWKKRRSIYKVKEYAQLDLGDAE